VRRTITLALLALTAASTVYAAALNFTPVITLTRLTTDGRSTEVNHQSRADRAGQETIK